MANCAALEDGLEWEVQHVEFAEKSLIALSSYCIDFENIAAKRIELRCSLLENNMFNPDRTLGYVFSTRDSIRNLPTLEFFKMDNIYPRRIKITIRNANIDNIKFAAFTFVVKQI